MKHQIKTYRTNPDGTRRLVRVEWTEDAPRPVGDPYAALARRDDADRARILRDCDAFEALADRANEQED